MERATGHVVTTSRCVMLPARYLLDHIDALLRLSHDAKDRAASAKLREMADELRIMVSVADVADFAAELSQGTPHLSSNPGSGVTTTGVCTAKRAIDPSSPRFTNRA
jgi:hypothetical protein